LKVLNCIILWILFSTTGILAQATGYTTNTEKLYTALYNNHFKTADTIVKQSLTLKSTQMQVSLINYYWWKIISGEHTIENTNAIARHIAVIETEIENKKIISNSELSSLLLAKIFKIRYMLHNKSTLSAINSVLSLKKYCIMLIENYHNNEQLSLLAGAYLYLIEELKVKNPVLIPLLALYPKGNRKQAIQLLQNGTKSDNIIIKNEANYILMKIYYNFENNYNQAEKHASYLVTQYPDNLIYGIEYYKIIKQNGKLIIAHEQKKRIENKIHNLNQLSNIQKKHFSQIMKQIN